MERTVIPDDEDLDALARAANGNPDAEAAFSTYVSLLAATDEELEWDSTPRDLNRESLEAARRDLMKALGRT